MWKKWNNSRKIYSAKIKPEISTWKFQESKNIASKIQADFLKSIFGFQWSAFIVYAEYGQKIKAK